MEHGKGAAPGVSLDKGGENNTQTKAGTRTYCLNELVVCHMVNLKLEKKTEMRKKTNSVQFNSLLTFFLQTHREPFNYK